MNNLIEQIETMSSREIAGLTGKQHSHVCRDIKKQLEEQNIGESKYGSTYIDVQNKERLYFNLDHTQTMILVTGYSIPLRAVVIKRWEELESVNKLNLPKTLPEALRAYANEIEHREAAEYKVSILRPKANLADKAIRNEETQYSIRDAGKHIGLRQKEIFKIMNDNKLLTKKRLPTQKAIDEKMLILRSVPDNEGHNWKQAVMTMEHIYNFNNKYNQFKLES